MAKRKDYDLMNYAKYRERRQRSSNAGKNLTKLWWLGRWAHKESEAKRKQRRRELDRKIKQNEKEYEELKKKNGPLTLKDIIIFLIMGVIGTVLIDVAINFGLKAVIGLIVAIIVIAFIIYLKLNPSEDVPTPNRLSESEIDELHRHLENIDMYKNIVNTSTDVYAVKCAMDELLSLIDIVMSYEEKDLNEAGMSKVKLPEQRKFIVDNYDTILEQVAEGVSE